MPQFRTYRYDQVHTLQGWTPCCAQVAQLRQPAVSTLVKTRTERRRLGEHERARAKFEASLGTPTNAQEFEDRCSPLCWQLPALALQLSQQVQPRQPWASMLPCCDSGSWCRLRRLRAWEAETWTSRKACLNGVDQARMSQLQEALLAREAAVSFRHTWTLISCSICCPCLPACIQTVQSGQAFGFCVSLSHVHPLGAGVRTPYAALASFALGSLP